MISSTGFLIAPNAPRLLCYTSARSGQPQHAADKSNVDSCPCVAPSPAPAPADALGDAPSDALGDAPSDALGDAPGDALGDAPGEAPSPAPADASVGVGLLSSNVGIGTSRPQCFRSSRRASRRSCSLLMSSRGSVMASVKCA